MSNDKTPRATPKLTAADAELGDCPNCADARAALADAIALADDFGAEVDDRKRTLATMGKIHAKQGIEVTRLRDEVEKWYGIAGKWMSELNDSIDKYNALRDEVQKVIAISDNSGPSSQCCECGQPVDPMLDNAVQCLEYVIKDDEGGDKEDAQSNADAGLVGTPTTPEIAVKPHRPAPSSKCVVCGKQPCQCPTQAK